jgi:hypothetical protein
MGQVLPPVGKETRRSLEKHGRGIRMDCKPRANNGHLVEQVDSCSKIQIERSMAAGQNGMLFF